MADDRTDLATDEELDVVEDVEWHVDDDGTEWFVEDGVRYELADDGFAYAVLDPEEAWPGQDVTSADEAAADDDTTEIVTPAPSPFSREGAAGQPAVGRVDEPPTVRVTTSGSASAADPDVREHLRDGALAGASPSSPLGHDALLQIAGLSSGYGSLPVLHGVDMTIRRGETAVLLGLNGAGKTTTAMNICGALKPWGGSISFDGADATSWSTTKCVANGIVMVPEGRRVFPDLSVAKNLQMGAWTHRKDKDGVEAQREQVFEYFPRLRERTSQLAGTLSGGEQQMLAIGRGLMARPKLLIIDEASMGLAPVIVKDVFDIVSEIAQDGVTVLLIEQNVGALDVADVGYVMEQGRMVKELRGEDLRDRSQVSEVLMG